MTQLPLTEIWDESGILSLKKKRQVGLSEVTDLLRFGQVRFAVADCGLPLRWLRIQDCYEFWKHEAKPRLVEPIAVQFRLEDFPGEYCFIAWEWGDAETPPVIVLERHH